MRYEATWVDPAEGWRYGFPRIYREETDGPIREWLLKNGYPQSMLEYPIRMWEATRDEKEND